MSGIRAAAARAAPWALMLIPAWLAVWTAHAIWLTYSPVPFNDQWVNFAAIRDARIGGWLNYLFSQHNEHRILFPRLVFLADLAWSHGNNAVNLIAIGVIQLAGAACFARMGLNQRLTALGVLALSTAVATTVTLMQWENLFWGFQVSFVAVYAAAAWALYLYFLAADEGGEVRWGVMVAAMVLLVVATFSMANGVFAGAAMAMAAVVTRRSRQAVAVAVITTALLLAVYLYGYHRIEAHSPPELALHHPGRFLYYVAIFTGNLWTQNGEAAALIGLVGFALSAGMLFVLVRKGAADPVRTALFGIVLFVGMSAAVTSVGRLSFGVEQALASRYMTPTAYFWAAQALFWALTLERDAPQWMTLRRDPEAWTLTLRRGPRSWVRLGFGAALILVLWRLVLLQQFGEYQVLATRERIISGSSALLSGLRDDQGIRDLYPLPELVAELRPELRERRLTIFEKPAGATIGQPLRARIVTGANVCRGFMDVLEPAKDGDGVWRALGWGWDVQARRSFERVVLTDSGGQVLGIGLSGLPRLDVPKLVKDVRDDHAGWLGRLRPGAGLEVIAYGVTRTGDACEIGRRAYQP